MQTMKNNFSVNHIWRHIGLIFFTTILMHGIVLLNNGVFWDGWIAYNFYLEQSYHTLRLISFSMGVPFFYYITRALMFLGYHSVCNLLGFFSIFIVGVCLYLSLIKFKQISLSIALLAGLVVVIFPGSQLTFFRAVSPYYFSYAIFFIAVYFGLTSETVHRCWPKYFLRILSLCCFLMSFSLKSLLCYYSIFFVGLYFLSAQEVDRQTFSLPFLFSFLLRKLDFILLPFAFYFLSKVFFSTYWEYAQYNHLHWRGLHWFIYIFSLSLYHVFFRFLVKPLIVWLFIIWLFIVIVIWLKNRCCKKKMTNLDFLLPEADISSRMPYVILFCVGLFALCMSVLPYILVDKPPIYFFLPASRCALLVPSAAALIIAGLWGVFFKTAKETISLIGKCFFLCLFVFSFSFWLNTYLKLTAETALQKSFISWMKDHPEWKKYSLFWINVHFKHIQPAYAHYTWANIINYVYKDHAHYGYSDQRPENFPALKKTFTPVIRQGYNIKNFNVNGRQATMDIFPNLYGHNQNSIAFRYLYYRFIHSSSLPNFMRGLIMVQVKPLY